MENYTLNKFLENIRLKKQYINKLNNEITNLNKIKNKEDNYALITSFETKKVYMIKYIIDITFSKTNTLLHVMDFAGNLKFYCSAGKLQYTGKNKKSRRLIVKDLYKILISNLDYLNNQPIALHFKNVGSARFSITRLLKKKFFIQVVKVFSTYVYNGCRKKKLRRKKFRTKKNS